MKKTKEAYNLIDIRKQAIAQHVHGLLRPHGKMWGMDVFSWSNPEIVAMADTIHSFPFKVLLVTNHNILDSLLEQDELVATNLQGVILFQSTKAIKDERLKFVDNVAYFNDVKSAFQQMYEWQVPRTIILFCSEGMDAELHQNEFNRFLEVHQIK